MSHRGPADDRELRERLRALRFDEPDGEFQASLRRRLLAAGPPDPLPRWRRMWRWHLPRPVLWPALGAAVGVATFLALTAIQSTPRAPTLVATRLPATKIALVRLNIATEVAVDAAHIRVTLPPELTFWADGRELGQRSFEWTQPLRSGDNEIPIAVRGQRPGRYRIAVTARIGDQQVEDEVVLEVVEG